MVQNAELRDHVAVLEADVEAQSAALELVDQELAETHDELVQAQQGAAAAKAERDRLRERLNSTGGGPTPVAERQLRRCEVSLRDCNKRGGGPSGSPGDGQPELPPAESVMCGVLGPRSGRLADTLKASRVRANKGCTDACGRTAELCAFGDVARVETSEAMATQLEGLANARSLFWAHQGAPGTVVRRCRNWTVDSGKGGAMLLGVDRATRTVIFDGLSNGNACSAEASFLCCTPASPNLKP